MHAMYMLIGNIYKDVRWKLTSCTWLLVAKIPVTKFPHTFFSGSKSMKTTMPGILCQWLFHQCMKIMLKSTCVNMWQYHIVLGPDGLEHLTMGIVMAWITDLEEQLVISGAQTYNCPVCLTSHHDLDCWDDAVSHTPCRGKITIAETLHICELYPEVSTYEFKQEMKKCNSGLSGATEEFCWEDLPVGPKIFLTQDLLHRCYKFVWDHVSSWLTHIVGEEELDHHFHAQPKLGFKNFSNGISKLSQTSGCKHRIYLKFIVVVIVTNRAQPPVMWHPTIAHRHLILVYSHLVYLCFPLSLNMSCNNP